MDWYNQNRPHSTLDGKTPKEVYQKWLHIRAKTPLSLYKSNPMSNSEHKSRRIRDKPKSTEHVIIRGNACPVYSEKCGLAQVSPYVRHRTE